MHCSTSLHHRGHSSGRSSLRQFDNGFERQTDVLMQMIVTVASVGLGFGRMFVLRFCAFNRGSERNPKPSARFLVILLHPCESGICQQHQVQGESMSFPPQHDDRYLRVYKSTRRKSSIPYPFSPLLQVILSSSLYPFSPPHAATSHTVPSSLNSKPISPTSFSSIHPYTSKPALLILCTWPIDRCMIYQRSHLGNRMSCDVHRSTSRVRI